jgi:molybdenum cofactor biosynthesis protein MoaC
MEFSHTDKKGKANMVDVSSKQETERTASACAEVLISRTIYNKIKRNEIAKGDVLSIAKFAGIQAAKKTSDLIPLCHNILITKVDLDLNLNANKPSVIIKSYAKTVSKTGIEMEALIAVTVAALTVYDMCKAIDKSIKITNVKLLSKTGGKSGDYKAKI